MCTLMPVAMESDIPYTVVASCVTSQRACRAIRSVVIYKITYVRVCV